MACSIKLRLLSSFLISEFKFPLIRAIAEYLSRDLPYKLTSDDVFITSGCTQAIDVALAMLARPGANILLPRPGFPIYELCSAFRNLEVRHFNLLPQQGWEVDLDAIETLADKNTVALVIINPGNPCGNVYSYQHLKKVGNILKKSCILYLQEFLFCFVFFLSDRRSVLIMFLFDGISDC